MALSSGVGADLRLTAIGGGPCGFDRRGWSCCDEPSLTTFRTALPGRSLHDKQPRQVSFTAACQYVLAAWTLLSADLVSNENIEAYSRSLLKPTAAAY
ncbi:MAG: hypothetical protein ACK5Q5_05095 [Planctomycetaceae bacterium]